MRKVIAGVVCALALCNAQAQSIQITSNGTTDAVVGKPDNFTGHAIITPMYPATAATGASTGLVTFAPGARTTWHTHPVGQLLIVTHGKGWVQEENQARREISAGDVVWIPKDVSHWHGATATSEMSHIAITYMKDGNNVTWQKPVSDEQYQPK